MTKICSFKTAKHRKGRSFDSAERFFYEAILSYGEEKNASLGRKSDLCGVFSSNAVTLSTFKNCGCKKLHPQFFVGCFWRAYQIRAGNRWNYNEFPSLFTYVYLCFCCKLQHILVITFNRIGHQLAAFKKLGIHLFFFIVVEVIEKHRDYSE